MDKESPDLGHSADGDSHFLVAPHAPLLEERGPRRSSTADLAWTAGSRWHIEECFQQAKGEAGLDHYQVRSWRAWYAHITLSMLALAWLAASRAQARKKGAGTSDPGMIGYTLPEIRRLLISLIQRYAPIPRTSGPGPAGAGDASTRPGSATTGAADTRSPEPAAALCQETRRSGVRTAASRLAGDLRPR